MEEGHILDAVGRCFFGENPCGAVEGKEMATVNAISSENCS